MQSKGMGNNWAKFKYANSSRLDIIKPDEGQSNVCGDWLRASGQKCCLFINGVLLKEIIEPYKKVEDNVTSLNLEEFIKKELLKDFQATEDQKNEAVQYLLKTLHQGGLMYPVSSVLTTILPLSGAYANFISDDIKRKVNIETTGNGFKVQEFFDASKILITDEESSPLSSFAERDDRNTGLLYLNASKIGSLIQAEGIVDIDFSENPSNPILRIESNHMSIYHKALIPYLDQRTFLQVIIDFIKNILGLNVVQSDIGFSSPSMSD